MDFEHNLKKINTISFIVDQEDETNLMKDITDLDDNDKDQNVMVKEGGLVTDCPSKKSILKTRKAPVVLFKTPHEDEQEIKIKREFPPGEEKISSNMLDIYSKEIISLMGKFMRDTLLKLLEAWKGEQGSNKAESLKY